MNALGTHAEAPKGPTTAATSVGIDLGTTTSAIAFVGKDGRPQVVPNLEGDEITPSIVLFDGDTAIVGQAAREALASEPENVVQQVKRRMGTEWTYTHRGHEYGPEHVSALILRKLIQDAHASLGSIDQAVITVPAHFNETMRNSTKIAGELAGLDVIGLVNEPTAAAVAFGAEENRNDSTMVVCDLGGGTFDVTVMKVSGGQFTVLASGGDFYLGGANFDKKLYDHFVSRYFEKFGIAIDDPNEVDGPAFSVIANDWLQRAEHLKRTLSRRRHANTRLTALGRTLNIGVDRSDFETMCTVLLEDIRHHVLNTLQDAGITPRETDDVLLVGGATRMPMMNRLAHEVFGHSPTASAHPEKDVAFGASLFATSIALREGKSTPMPAKREGFLSAVRVTDVASHSLGVKVYDRPPAAGGTLINNVILPRNTPLPSSGSERFYTTNRGQTSITVDVLEGDSSDVSLARDVGCHVEITDLPEQREPGKPVVVTMRYNESGLLEVQAMDEETGTAATAVVQRMSGLSPDKVDESNHLMRGIGVE